MEASKIEPLVKDLKGSFKKIDNYMSDIEPVKVLFNAEKTKRYSVGETLGKGGFAKVFLAEESDAVEQFDRKVAIKIVPKKRLVRKDQLDKIHTEIEIQYMCRHQNIVKMFSSWQDSHMFCLVLEYCDGGSLSSFAKTFPNRRVPEETVVNIGQQVVSAVQYIHAKRILHRDIKTGNILLTNGVAKLADFGLAITFEKNEGKQTLCGTPNFLAPEVFYAKRHCESSDVWALGCVLYCLLAGEAPFRFTDLKDTARRIMNGAFVVPSSFSDEARMAITRIMWLQPQERLDLAGILDEPLFRKYLKQRKRVSSENQVSQLGSVPPSPVMETPKKRSKVTAIQSPRQPLQQIAGNTRNNKGRSFSRGKAIRKAGRRNSRVALDLNNLSRSMECLSIDLNEGTTPKEPLYVSKWVDNTNFQGLGYTLSNKNAGICFKNGSSIRQANGERTSTTWVNQQSESVPLTTPRSRSQSKALKILEEFKDYMNDKLVASVVSPTKPDRGTDLDGGDIFVNCSLRSTTSITFGLSDKTHQLNILHGDLKGIKLVVGQDGLLLISKSRTKKFFTWKSLLSKSCRIYNGLQSAPPVDELHGFLGVTVQNMIDMLSYAERKTLQLHNDNTRDVAGLHDLRKVNRLLIDAQPLLSRNIAHINRFTT